MDTLLLMGLEEEYRAARDWVVNELSNAVGCSVAPVPAECLRPRGGLLRRLGGGATRRAAMRWAERGAAATRLGQLSQDCANSLPLAHFAVVPGRLRGPRMVELLNRPLALDSPVQLHVPWAGFAVGASMRGWLAKLCLELGAAGEPCRT
eukprot:365930-Chlamydomonas_euryale.AAC.34